ncbi:MAG TPA: DUF4136 domain-containing protein [Cyclobacteriaceae bacterium]
MKAKLLVVLPLVILLIEGCEPKPDSAELLDQLVVQTYNDDTVAYGLYSTFAIPTDTIAFYSNTYNAPSYITPADAPDFVSPVVNRVITNMTNRHYTKVSKKSNPDLGVNVSIVHDYSVYQSYYGGGGYGGGYYGYGGYYGGGYVVTTEENRGSLIVEIVDLKNKTVDNKVKVVWTATLSDLFNAIDQTKESIDAIDQAFKQSPYIVTNN